MLVYNLIEKNGHNRSEDFLLRIGRTEIGCIRRNRYPRKPLDEFP